MFNRRQFSVWSGTMPLVQPGLRQTCRLWAVFPTWRATLNIFQWIRTKSEIPCSPPEPPSPNLEPTPWSQVDTVLQFYQNYHNHKETMAFSGLLLFFAGEASLMFSNPIPEGTAGNGWLEGNILLAVGMLLAGAVYVLFQLHSKAQAATIVLACLWIDPSTVTRANIQRVAWGGTSLPTIVVKNMALCDQDWPVHLLHFKLQKMSRVILAIMTVWTCVVAWAIDNGAGAPVTPPL